MVRQRVILVIERDGRRVLEASEALLSSGYWVVETRSVAGALRELDGGLAPRAVLVSAATLRVADAAARERIADVMRARGTPLIVVDRHDGIVARLAAALDEQPIRTTG